MRGQSGNFKKYSWPILILSVLFTTAMVVDLAFVNTPTFHTDLADFAPDSESADAHDRISQHFSNETRPMFVHVTADDGSNILDLSDVVLMNNHLEQVKSLSSDLDDAVLNYVTAPSILQLALDEEANGTNIEDVESWEEMLNLVI
ncbi:MAG: hypothetical protein VW862_01760, partial [Euryarchaeota archaeon]